MVLDLLVTICARSGSKRLINKNILKINNKTLIEISIEQALKVVPRESIVFSSDSDYYLSIAKKYKVNLNKRKKKLSSDSIGKLDVIKDLCKDFNQKFIIDLDVTAPVRDRNDIDGVYKNLINDNKVVFAGCKMESINPYFNMVEIKKDLRIDTVKKSSIKISQNSPTVYLLNGIIGWERNYLLSSKKLLGTKNFCIWEMEEHKMFDIDTYFDYKIIKSILE